MSFERNISPKQSIGLGLRKKLRDIMEELWETKPMWLAYTPEEEIEDILSKKIGHPVIFKKIILGPNDINLQVFIKGDDNEI